MTGEWAQALAVRTGDRLRPDPRRVIVKLFVPGEESPDSPSRAQAVIDRILAMTDPQVAEALSAALAAFAQRHRDLPAVLRRHFAVVAHGRRGVDELSEQRELLIGAYFTHEYAVEAAALCNPSMVAHPDQTGLAAGQIRFLMSVRAIGEGHLSGIGFRTGVAGPGGQLVFDDPSATLVTGTSRPPVYDRGQISATLAGLDVDEETVDLLLRGLPDRFDAEELHRGTGALHPHLLARRAGQRAVEVVSAVSATNYDLTFAADTAIGERLLWPNSPTESHGMEDARFVRFTDHDGSVRYCATYTAYDGERIAPQLLMTEDFRTFSVRQLTGSAAADKGMALFPRPVGGRYLALSRWDRETTSLASSDDGYFWRRGPVLHAPGRGWELVKVGNCGSPVETDRGWLVLTHGVGVMRTYAIGALLLDLDDPTRVLAALPEPLLVADVSERDGYVPNVVYSCGALRHGDTLIIPYGASDAFIRVAEVHLPALLDRLVAAPPDR